MPANNGNLRKADSAKNDEFYTQFEDINNELYHYRNYFRGKTIFLNCDDPEESNFWRYFWLNFEFFGIKKVIATHYDQNRSTYKLETTDGKTVTKTILQQNGDFRSPECVEILKEADIICTNPPFSLFREFVAQLVEYEKKFIIMGNMNAVTYKEIFRLIKENKLWLGYSANKTMEFRLGDSYEKWDRIDSAGNKYGKVPSITWFTNLETSKRNEELILWKKYNPEEYPHYDNYDAINVDRVAEIPMNYPGNMGVPITFLDKYNPGQFEVIDGLNRYSILDGPTSETRGKYLAQVRGKPIYVRVVIRNLKPESI